MTDMKGQTQHLADLCTLLVKENYGELTAVCIPDRIPSFVRCVCEFLGCRVLDLYPQSFPGMFLTSAQRIFALLCRRGRQPIDGILKHTRLAPRQVRHALVVLHQQNLIYHNTEKETRITFYEANQDAAYYLLRNGRILDIVSERYGDDARYVLVNILDFGRVRISDLHEAITEAKQKESTKAPHTNGVSNGINGHSDNDSSSVFPLGSILAQLLDDGILEPVVANMFRSPTDTYNEVEKKIIRESYGGSIKGAKQGIEVKGRVSDTLRAIREERQIWKKGSKRVNGDYTNGVADKKRKLANGQYATNGSAAELDDPRLDVRLFNFSLELALTNL
jgi:DNA-directed RNA polymerase III subunit RPC3